MTRNSKRVALLLKPLFIWRNAFRVTDARISVDVFLDRFDYDLMS
jgi:hypothetical protein